MSTRSSWTVPNTTLAALHLHKRPAGAAKVVVPEGSGRHAVINKEKHIHIYAQQKLEEEEEEEEEEVATG